jgi:hypothetical protein
LELNKAHAGEKVPSGIRTSSQKARLELGRRILKRKRTRKKNTGIEKEQPCVETEKDKTLEELVFKTQKLTC